MQAKIGPRTKNILPSLHYNEQKVVNGKAERIKAENFLKDHDQLTKSEIIERFRDRTSLTEHHHNVGRHIFLNFGERENLTNEKMSKITERYMSAMGFEEQPYVVYRHQDAGHHHLHVVATTVRSDGTYIDLGPREYHNSYNISKALEKEFSLEISNTAQVSRQADFAVDHAQRVIYGEQALKRAVSNVLNTIVDRYNYTTLDELNAVLKQYNVEANSGIEGSRVRETGGLLYHALDNNGHHIGVPLKASSFLLQPTLKNLEQKFERNQEQRETAWERVSTAIEWALAGRTPDWAGFTASLEKEGVSVLVTKDDDRVFFIDHTGKSSFEGKSLGEGYALEALRQRCAPVDAVTDDLIQKQQLRLHL